MLAYSDIAFGSRDSGDQNRRQQRAFLYIEVIARSRQVLECVVAEALVGVSEGQEGNERQQRECEQHALD